MLEREAERWLSIQENFGKAPNTLLTHCRSLECYGSFCDELQRPVYEATKGDVDLFVRSMNAFRLLRAGRRKRAVRDGQRHGPAALDGGTPLL